ncbi:MAG: folate-binding protein [Alphaproteobacteria bacterium]|nr:folate-binding protein [Alphaproteobacteria bacterium]MDP6812788.1 folate-binding protein [Alphaproteobacteria bacterium]
MPEPRYAILPARGVLELSGEESRSFLQALITRDMDHLTPRAAIYSALLTPQGKYLFDFFLADAGDRLLLDGEAARLADLAQRLNMYRLRAKVAIADVSADRQVIAAFGDGAAAALGLAGTAGAARPFADGLAFVDPRLAEAGARLIAPAATAAAALEAAGLSQTEAEDYDLFRLDLALPDGSRDLAVDKALLLESNFEALNGVDFDKGCFVGQELTARTKYRGLVRKRLLPVRVDGPMPAPDTPLLADGKEVGVMRSGRDGRGLALLRLERLADGGAGPLTGGQATLTPIRPDWADFDLPA